jgi:hypothetical protein
MQLRVSYGRKRKLNYSAAFSAGTETCLGSGSSISRPQERNLIFRGFDVHLVTFVGEIMLL